MKVILKRDEFNELKKEYEVHHIEQDKYGNKRIYLNQHRWVAPSLVEKFIVGENMNISIYELLGKMKDYEAPNKIIYDTKIWTYNGNDYEDENGWCLFDEYVITDILRDEVYILETEVTLHDAEQCREDEQQNKIRKIDENSNIFNKGFVKRFTENEKILIDKINEIIEVINEK